jgi:hypothetical protein
MQDMAATLVSRLGKQADEAGTTRRDLEPETVGIGSVGRRKSSCYAVYALMQGISIPFYSWEILICAWDIIRVLWSIQSLIYLFGQMSCGIWILMDSPTHFARYHTSY